MRERARRAHEFLSPSRGNIDLSAGVAGLGGDRDRERVREREGEREGRERERERERGTASSERGSSPSDTGGVARD